MWGIRIFRQVDANGVLQSLSVVKFAQLLAHACGFDAHDRIDSRIERLGTIEDGNKLYQSFEEGSHLKEYIYKWTGGTGKYQGVSGGGTYTYDSLTDNLSGGRFKGALVLP